MRKKYFWHFVFLIFIIFSLANLFQKLKWTAPTDNITWHTGENGLICLKAPGDSLIKPGDILLTINDYRIKSKLDLNRVIQLTATPSRNICKYEVERAGLLQLTFIPISKKTTSISYYILVFCGLFFTLITLNILNTNIKYKTRLTPPAIYYLLSLCFSGFLIFSPTGSYDPIDFIFLALDQLAFLFFPALLLHYAIFFPRKSFLARKIKPKILSFIIYSIPTVIIIVHLIFLIKGIIDPIPDHLMKTINNFRSITPSYFGILLGLSFLLFLTSNLRLILKNAQKKLIIPLAGILISIPSLIIITLLPPPVDQASTLSHLSLFSIILLPISLTYFLSRRRFTDIESIIKKTASVSTIFLFIFIMYFFLDINIEKNISLLIFGTIATLFAGGLIYRPIEETVLKNFERIFFRSTYNFKRKLRELVQSVQTERNLSALSSNFLNTINNGFQLHQSALIILSKKKTFLMLPKKNKITLSKSFQTDLFNQDNLSFYSPQEFDRKYPKEFAFMKEHKYFQFLPLKTQDKLIGLVAFSLKKDNTYLSVEDWELLFSIMPSLALSVENASLYSELESQFSEISLLKEFNENIIININLGIVVLSKLNIISTWNQFMEINFKIPKEKAVNRKTYKVLSPELWKKIQNKKQGLLNNIKLEICEKELIFDIYLSPLKDNHGNNIGTILVFEDVTGKILIQNQLIMSEKMASLGLLSAGIAHEVNTPLTGISSYCQFIIDNPDNSDNMDLISKIQEQVIRANKIVRTLLDFSRQKGELPIEVDLNRTIDESIALIEHKLKKKDIKLIKTFQFQNKLTGYITRLQQLFINLLINASDAIDGNKGIIRIVGSETDHTITIRIEDNGRGIPAKITKHIFDPFYTTKEQGEGTGLGLSISYNIIKDHYGDMKLDATVTKGTAFIITLPLDSPLRRIKI